MTEQFIFSGTPLEIMIVEGNPVAAEILRCIMVRAGYQVRLATNGEEGLQSLREHPCALVISDIPMPLMNGYEMCRAIKHDEKLWSTRVILLTMLSEPKDIVTALVVGADSYITKPYIEADLLHRINTLLANPVHSKPAKERRKIHVEYGGESYDIASSGQQMVGLLLSVYESSLTLNRELICVQDRFDLLNKELGRKYDEALIQGEDKLRKITESVQDAIIMMDENQCISFWNAAAARIFGHTAAEALGQDLHALLVPSRAQAQFSQALPHFQTTGKGPLIGKTNEVSALRKSGEKFPVELSLSSIRINEQWHAIAIVRDITERKQSECMVQERMKELNCFYQVNHDMQQNLSEDVFLQRCIEYLISAMQFPEITAAVIELNDKRYAAANYTAGLSHHLHAQINAADGTGVGHVRVYYVQDQPFIIPFEQNLIDGIADSISSWFNRQQAIKEIRRSEEKFRTLFQLSSDALMLLDKKGFFDCNEATLKMFGCSTRDEFMGRQLSQFSPPTQPDGEDSSARFSECIATAFETGSNHFEWLYCRFDGSEFSTEVLMTAIELNGRQVLQATVRDISQRKQAEQSLLCLNRALKTLGRVNETLIRTTKQQELLDETCRLLVETGGYRLAWIGLVVHDATKTVRVVAHHGDDRGYLELMKITWEASERGQGPAGRAIRSGQLVYTQDILADPAFAPWRDEATVRGYRSCISLPLLVDYEVFGVLSLYAAQVDTFDAAEIGLLTELASDLAFGINMLRIHAERDTLQQEAIEDAIRHKEVLIDTVRAIARTVEMRDPYTAGHQQCVAQLAAAIATELGLVPERIKGIYLGALIHDIGKIYIPAEILNRPGKLTSYEFEMIKTHPQVGYDIIKEVKFPWPIASMVLQHHECLDGSGYPYGLVGEDIILEARILSVADVVEAMSSHRPYRPALGVEKGLAEITRHRGDRYDAEVVDACLRLFHEQGYALPNRLVNQE